MVERRNTQVGFTWVELLVTLAMLGILLSVGVGSWPRLRATQIKHAMLHDLARAFAFARTEAFLSAETLVFLPKRASGDWSSGMVLQPETSERHVMSGDARHVWHWHNARIHLTWHGFRGTHDLVVSHIPHRLAMNGYFLVDVQGLSVERWVVNRFGRIRVLRKHVD
jgi:prepilin-type N-terminal cleavage/methylation domain-containing protein